MRNTRYPGQPGFAEMSQLAFGRTVVGGRVEQVGDVTVGRMRLRFTTDTDHARVERFVDQHPHLTLSWGAGTELEGLTE
mgnify:CR=1 FL=1